MAKYVNLTPYILKISSIINNSGLKAEVVYDHRPELDFFKELPKLHRYPNEPYIKIVDDSLFCDMVCKLEFFETTVSIFFRYENDIVFRYKHYDYDLFCDVYLPAIIDVYKAYSNFQFSLRYFRDDNFVRKYKIKKLLGS